MTVAEAAVVGARRIGVEGTLARTARACLLRAALEIADPRSFSKFEMLLDVDTLFPAGSGP